MSIYPGVMTITSWCGTCRARVFFEHPDCGDDHSADCAEWACIECGEAIVMGFELADPHAGAAEVSLHVA
jgi:hypothetical protein